MPLVMSKSELALFSTWDFTYKWMTWHYILAANYVYILSAFCCLI
jgi:hypothetical protein